MPEIISIFVGADFPEQLPLQVLKFSINRHTTAEVEYTEVDNDMAPKVTDPRYQPFTNFSFGRFAIPKLKNYEGKGIYMDSDMLALADIKELWDSPFNGAKILTVNREGAGGSNKKTAVMLMDCEQLPWDAGDIVAGLGKHYDYKKLMSFSPLLDNKDMQEGICYGWNCLDAYNDKTRMIHYTNIQTQPWVSLNSEWRRLWIDELKLMLEQGAIDIDKIKREVELGYIRPSLLDETGVNGEVISNKEQLQAIDDAAGYRPHEKLLDRHKSVEQARLKYEYHLDPENFRKNVMKQAFQEFYRHPIKFFAKKKYKKHIERLSSANH